MNRDVMDPRRDVMGTDEHGREVGDDPPRDGPSLRRFSPAMADRLRAAVENYRKGAFAEAETLARNLLEEVENVPQVLELLGLSLVAQRRSEEAEPYLLEALRVCGESSNLLFALGVAAADRGAWNEAGERYRRLLALDPNFPDALFNYARALEESGKTNESLDSYKELLEKDTSHADALLHYALLLEECNRADESAVWLARFLTLCPTDPRGLLLAAQLALRHARFHEALAILEKLEKVPLTRRTAAVVSGRRVRALDALGRYAEAARAADEGHARIRALAGGAEDPLDPYGPQAVDLVARHRDRLRAHDPGWTWPDNLLAPSFLVGFPRSGTTLLDRMLAVHPDVRVLEEENPLAPLFRRLAQSLARDSSTLALDREGSAEATRIAETLAQGEPPGVRVLLDKLPLNSIYAGWLGRVVPKGRFLVAVRDPRDVVLSCWLQVFAPNTAMRQFWDLRTAVDYYGRVMELLRFWLEEALSPERCALVRYEDVVREPTALLGTLSSFLGIGFCPEMVEPARAAKGVRLGTPSYDQVSRPIHDASVGRWRHYENTLAPYLDRLEPWVRYWGYEDG